MSVFLFFVSSIVSLELLLLAFHVFRADRYNSKPHKKRAEGALMTGQSGGIGGPPNLGVLGPMGSGIPSSQIGPEFGTNFPAPSIEDYNDSSEKEEITTVTTSVDIDGGSDVDITTVASGPGTSPITLFPEEQETKSITKQTTPQPLKEIRIQLPKTSRSSINSDYTDEVVTTDGESRVAITTKAGNDGDENLLMPDRVSAAKTLNAETQTEVPNLSKLIDVLRKSRLKESEIMEIVSQVEGNDNIVKSSKIEFSAAVQNIPLKKQRKRERIAKATRELQDNIEPPEKAARAHLAHFRQLPDLASSATTTISDVTRSVVHSAEKTHFTATQQLPPLTQAEFTAENQLHRKIIPIKIEEAPYSPSSPTLGTLGEGQYTTQPNYVTALYSSSSISTTSATTTAICTTLSATASASSCQPATTTSSTKSTSAATAATATAAAAATATFTAAAFATVSSSQHATAVSSTISTSAATAATATAATATAAAATPQQQQQHSLQQPLPRLAAANTQRQFPQPYQHLQQLQQQQHSLQQPLPGVAAANTQRQFPQPYQHLQQLQPQQQLPQQQQQQSHPYFHQNQPYKTPQQVTPLQQQHFQQPQLQPQRRDSYRYWCYSC
ncbi:hypothetical protein KIN20_000697 [Parelaphostrongylus tenuis]|uniref:Uncharacterized protein n=1 Tax=Parelaphostrongylus tenuis TaxID=148309 RepID=A0AAD5QG90_PARTN|nr:hypothetical protein KIN20_000697 [Parelaphostrongylus tenuis]